MPAATTTTTPDDRLIEIIRRHPSIAQLWGDMPQHQQDALVDYVRRADSVWGETFLDGHELGVPFLVRRGAPPIINQIRETFGMLHDWNDALTSLREALVGYTEETIGRPGITQELAEFLDNEAGVWTRYRDTVRKAVLDHLLGVDDQGFPYAV